MSLNTQPHQSSDDSSEKRAIGNTGTSRTDAVKTCSRCGVNQPTGAFFYKETEGRYESTCKVCKRQARRARCVAGQSASDARQEPERTIEPVRPPVSAAPVGFELWERMYGRPLNEVERIEVRTNLMAFFKTLMDEDRRQRNGT